MLTIVAGAAPVRLPASTLVPLKPVAVLPMAGILIGGAMTATSPTGRHALDELRERRGEYEGGLALGLLPHVAGLEVCRDAARWTAVKQTALPRHALTFVCALSEAVSEG